MNEEILYLAEERATHKNRKPSEYKDIHKLVLKKIEQAKENWLQGNCQEIDLQRTACKDLQQKHDDFNLHEQNIIPYQ